MTNEPNSLPTESNKKGKKILLIVLICFLSLIILLAGTFFALREIGRRRFRKDNTAVSVPEEIYDDVEDFGTEIIYKGHRYEQNENIVSVLLIGVDKDNIQAQENYGSNGQADVLIATTFDTKTGRICMIPLSRESMVDVDVYSVKGAFAKTEKMQICLAYAYGKTGDESCRNVLLSAERLLCGMDLDSYVAIDMAGIKSLTKAIGGVPIQVLETFSDGNAHFTEGQEIVLTEKNVDPYIRGRDTDVNANNRRMARQKQFLTAFAGKAGNMVLKDFRKLTTLYNTGKPFTVSDLGLPEVTYLASCCLTADVGSSIDFISIQGEMKEGEQYTEFYPDVNSLFEAVLNAFYVQTD